MTTDEIMALADEYAEGYLSAPVGAIIQMRSNLRTAIDSLVADAARYRWLREHPAWETEAFLSGLTAEQFDAAIDAAMELDKR